MRVKKELTETAINHSWHEGKQSNRSMNVQTSWLKVPLRCLSKTLLNRLYEWKDQALIQPQWPFALTKERVYRKIKISQFTKDKKNKPSLMLIAYENYLVDPVLPVLPVLEVEPVLPPLPVLFVFPVELVELVEFVVPVLLGLLVFPVLLVEPLLPEPLVELLFPEPLVELLLPVFPVFFVEFVLLVPLVEDVLMVEPVDFVDSVV